MIFSSVSAIILMTAVITAECLPVDNWLQWKQQYGKSYANQDDENSRRSNFLKNKAEIEEHNKNSASSSDGFKMEINELSDLSFAQLQATRLGLKAPANALISQGQQVFSAPALQQMLVGASLPQSLDWRTKGAVTSVKNQGNCGSCWAFSSTGALEGRRFVKTGSLVSLSEQNLMDCSYSYGNNACNGGWMNNAFRYVRAVGGINMASAYPYTATSSTTCKFNNATAAKYAALNSTIYYSVKSGNETALMEALQSGPVSIAFNVLSSFQSYRSGVYSDSTCGTTSVNHGMLLVGYGNDNTTSKPYWLVKNSWGPNWGEQGYVRVLRGVNMCAIATYPSYPMLL